MANRIDRLSAERRRIERAISNDDELRALPEQVHERLGNTQVKLAAGLVAPVLAGTRRRVAARLGDPAPTLTNHIIVSSNR